VLFCKFAKKNRMKTEIKNISRSLNKAYLARSLYIDDIKLFKENFETLLHATKPSDSEETLKDYINIFFRDTYYKNKFAIKENVNNIDLAIYNGKDETAQIGVLIETKALKNNAEMISADDLNKKAFQELIKYYLEERKKNLEIKHLIITNSIDWYIFDATEFERIFYENKDFLKTYNDWANERLVNKNSDLFYTEIAKPFIATTEESIVCTHFKLPDLNQISTLSNEKWIELYKVFSPEHLLKLPFQNDSNTLNREFYNELLYIVGLQETKVKNVRKIERLPEKERQDGSFMENAVNILISDELISRKQTLSGFENLTDLDEEEQLFSIGLELCITWLNRILFLKLLESQLVKYNNSKDFLFLNTSKIRDFEELRELFFEVLAVKTNERKAVFQNKFSKIPYLNSSLFELTDLERETVKINQLKTHYELPVFGATVLKDENGKKISGKLPVLQYLFDFLDSYNFASDNKAEIQDTNKTIINSAVLGLIFEKLNGYKEGSYYTPGFVTMYMCRENIRKTVVQKFKAENEFKTIENFTDLYNQIDKIPIQKANEIFNSLKICDPAVGSGHFLVSALNELITLKSELKILIDSNGKRLRDLDIEVINDELYLTVEREAFTYNYKKSESQNVQKTLFHEKQNLIENCLFGVDINPKSVNICRLRLWIELLKNAYYTKESNYTELETLPNIDINIKCGNSLISHFSLNGKTNSQSLKTFTQKYKQVVADYKNTTDRSTKRALERFITEQKENFARTVNPNDEDLKNIRKIESEIGTMPIFFNKDEQTQWQLKLKHLGNEKQKLQELYDEKLKSIYSNSFEWRFEFPEVLDDNGYFVGFDLVIGNPPYMYSRNQKFNNLEKKYYYTNFQLNSNQLNTFGLFIERATHLLNKTGRTSFIIPNNFLTINSYSKFRKYLVENFNELSFVNILSKVFEKANVDTCVLNFAKNETKILTLGEFEDEKLIFLKEIDIKQLSAPDYIIQISAYKNSEIYAILEKIEKNSFQLHETATVSTGLKVYQTGKGKPAQTDDIKQNRKFHSTTKFNQSYEKYLEGADVGRYLLKWSGEYLNYGEWIAEQRKTVPFSGKRLLVRQIPSLPPYCINSVYTEDTFYNDINSMVIFKPLQFDLHYIIALLNSKLLSFWFVNTFDKLQRNIFPQFKVNELAQFPICKTQVTDPKYTQIIGTTGKILAAKKQNPKADTKKLEQQIDKLVYKLYNLTETEIKTIESQL